MIKIFDEFVIWLAVQLIALTVLDEYEMLELGTTLLIAIICMGGLFIMLRKKYR